MRIPGVTVGMVEEKRNKSLDRVKSGDVKRGSMITGDINATKKWLQGNKLNQFERGESQNNYCFECKAPNP